MTLCIDDIVIDIVQCDKLSNPSIGSDDYYWLTIPCWSMTRWLFNQYPSKWPASIEVLREARSGRAVFQWPSQYWYWWYCVIDIVDYDVIHLSIRSSIHLNPLDPGDLRWFPVLLIFDIICWCCYSLLTFIRRPMSPFGICCCGIWGLGCDQYCVDQWWHCWPRPHYRTFIDQLLLMTHWLTMLLIVDRWLSVTVFGDVVDSFIIHWPHCQSMTIRFTIRESSHCYSIFVFDGIVVQSCWWKIPVITDSFPTIDIGIIRSDVVVDDYCWQSDRHCDHLLLLMIEYWWLVNDPLMILIVSDYWYCIQLFSVPYCLFHSYSLMIVIHWYSEYSVLLLVMIWFDDDETLLTPIPSVTDLTHCYSVTIVVIVDDSDPMMIFGIPSPVVVMKPVVIIGIQYCRTVKAFGIIADVTWSHSVVFLLTVDSLTIRWYLLIFDLSHSVNFRYYIDRYPIGIVDDIHSLLLILTILPFPLMMTDKWYCWLSFDCWPIVIVIWYYIVVTDQWLLMTIHLLLLLTNPSIIYLMSDQIHCPIDIQCCYWQWPVILTRYWWSLDWLRYW